MTGEDLARAAASFVGVTFRLHGRDPNYGVDCIGLLQVALEKAGSMATLPNGYPLRLRSPQDWIPDPGAFGFAPAAPPYLPGDVILVSLGRSQAHLAIAGTTSTWIHAHAGLRRVVISPSAPQGEVIGHWRLKPSHCE